MPDTKNPVNIAGRTDAISLALALSVNEGRYSEAFATVEKALRTDPSNPGLIAAMGLILNSAQLKDLRNFTNMLALRIDRNAYATLQAMEPVGAYVAAEYLGNDRGHYHLHYHNWRTVRLRKLLSLVGDDLSGRSVLVLGDGQGDIGGFIAGLGADVTAIEIRDSNRRIANLRYATKFGHRYKAIGMDMNEIFSSIGGFDHIVSFGSMEVIFDIATYMESCAAISDDVILETLVCDSLNDDYTVEVLLDSAQKDNPASGKSLRASPSYIERKFESLGFLAARHFNTDLNTLFHKYDWEHKDKGEANEHLRRFWRFQKETPTSQ